MSAVIGLPDPRWGDVVTAFVVLRPNCQCTPDSLINHVKARKGSVQAPKRVELVADLPMTPLGKIDKRALHARLGRPQAGMLSPPDLDRSHG
jgi:fatty-acyl-CoA synthase